MSLLRTQVNIDRTFLFKRLDSLHKIVASPVLSNQRGGMFITSYYDSQVTITWWLYCETTTTEFSVRRHRVPTKNTTCALLKISWKIKKNFTIFLTVNLITKWHIWTSEWCEYDSFYRSNDDNLDDASYMYIMLLSGHLLK